MKRICATLFATVLSVNAFADPAAVAVPAGHSLAMTAVGTGELAYECKVKANTTDVYEWTFVGPTAVLTDKASKAVVGKYYAGPTWEANDGSKVGGKQLAVSPAAAGNIPLQLVQAAPSTGKGAMNDITYIQRTNTKGGVAPSDACTAATAGAKKMVKYEADYLFYKKS